MASPIKVPTLTITEMIDSSPSAIAIYFAIIDFVNMFSSMPISAASQSQFTVCLHLCRHIMYPYLATPAWVLQQLCHDTQSLRQGLNFIQLSPGANINHTDDILLQGDPIDTLSQTFIKAHKKGTGVAPHIVQGPITAVKSLKTTW